MTERAAAGRSFRFDYRPGVLRFGEDSVADLAPELDSLDVERALVVTGRTVGDTPAVIDPVTAGLGDRLAGVFAETTPAKRLATAYDVVDAMAEHDADGLVALGGGSSLDVASVASVLAATERDRDGVSDEFAESGTIAVPEADLPALAVVPTTLAGAELSQVAGITASPESGLVETKTGGGIGHPALMPDAVFHDPALVATTPRPILAASAMNGFDKALESTYARNATPITDATATRSLAVLQDALPALGSDPVTPADVEPVLEGILLAQYGISRPDGTTLSLVHAFGHALTRTYDVQQGAAHAIIAPHAIAYLLEEVDAGRELLVEAFDVEDSADDDAIVHAVEQIRDALGLASRLRDVDGPDRSEFDTVAQHVLGDSFMENAPNGLDATQDEIVQLLNAAY
ncbi:iron-containing alcohol dehydrogenase [Halorubellus sp. JP-L1]|uniref:iron-containing alcohol dehydrogenase family protein n=1 Tax=Halorubellus sp. JP-L1 TaxID=2715753 RepID=UPI00140942B0|nr:iron-containing alcohol dehydrogenase family protein [Halorubellus sp. JP-L1]NHN40404.1 iron-containing alcohol dehydrogenase [Halorubellus sp. JP-L1]